jgi:mannose-1-phosphate guanylyltransferase
VCDRYGIKDVLINAHAHVGAIRDFLSQQSIAKVRVVEEQELLGSAGTLANNREWVASEDCFWVFYADVLSQVNLFEMLQLHRLRKPTATIAAHRVPDPSRCGILKVSDDGIVTDFVEKPITPCGNLAFSGILIGTPALLDVIPRHCPADLGFDVFPQLAGKMAAFPVSGYLLDIGTMGNYELAQRTWPGLLGKGTIE